MLLWIKHRLNNAVISIPRERHRECEWYRFELYGGAKKRRKRRRHLCRGWHTLATYSDDATMRSYASSNNKSNRGRVRTTLVNQWISEFKENRRHTNPQKYMTLPQKGVYFVHGRGRCCCCFVVVGCGLAVPPNDVFHDAPRRKTQRCKWILMKIAIRLVFPVYNISRNYDSRPTDNHHSAPMPPLEH